MAINFLQNVDLNKGEIQNVALQNAGTNPGTPATGQIYFNTGDNTLRIYNGTSWDTYSTATGDITSVQDGNGLTGGADTGDVTLSVGAGTGITVNTDDVAVSATQTGITSILNTSLVVGRDADNQIKFGTDNQIIFRVSAGDGVIFKASGEIEATKFDGDLEGNADTATALATARNINGVAFDGTGDITVTAAGSTLSDTVTVVKGGTGTTSYIDNQIIAYNSGTGKLEGHNVFIEQPVANSYKLKIGDGSATSTILASENGAPLTISVDLATGTNTAGSDLTLTAGLSTGSAEGGDIVFRSSPSGSSGAIPNANTEIAKIDNLGNLQLDGGITTGSTSFVNSSGLIQVANQSNITGVGTISSGTWNGTAIASAYLDADTAHLSTTQTFTGAKTFTGTLALTGTGRITGVDTVSDSTDAANKAYVDALTLDDVSNANLLTALASLESSGGAANENIVIGADSGDTIVITGNLQVSGTTTTVNSTVVDIADNNITLSSGNATSAPIDGAGITIEGGTGDDVGLSWYAAGTRFRLFDGGGFANFEANETRVKNLTINNTLVTSTAAELNTLDGYLGSVTEFNYLKDLYDTGVTSTEFDYLDGVTSNIQTQLDGKAASGHAADVGGSTSVAITHNLGTRDVSVQLYDNTTYDTVYADVVRTDTNTVTFNFRTAPAAAAYRCVITRI